MPWDPKEWGSRYQVKAENDEQYLSKIKGQVKLRPTYEPIFDEHLASYYVFNRLHGRTFLESKAKLLAELTRMLSEPPETKEAYDLGRFQTFYRRFVEAELKAVQAAEA